MTLKSYIVLAALMPFAFTACNSDHTSKKERAAAEAASAGLPPQLALQSPRPPGRFRSMAVFAR